MSIQQSIHTINIEFNVLLSKTRWDLFRYVWRGNTEITVYRWCTESGMGMKQSVALINEGEWLEIQFSQHVFMAPLRRFVKVANSLRASLFGWGWLSKSIAGWWNVLQFVFFTELLREKIPLMINQDSFDLIDWRCSDSCFYIQFQEYCYENADHSSTCSYACSSQIPKVTIFQVIWQKCKDTHLTNDWEKNCCTSTTKSLSIVRVQNNLHPVVWYENSSSYFERCP